MKYVLLIAIIATLALSGIAPAQNLHRSWEFSPPSQHFPKFFSSDLKHDILLNDFLARYWFSSQGLGAYSGTQETVFREWDAMCSAWIDTSRWKSMGFDYNGQLRDFLLRVQLDADGYVYTYPPNADRRDKLGWASPNYTKSGGLSKGWDWDKPGGDQEGWRLVGGGTRATANSVWSLTLVEPEAYIQADKLAIEAFQSPYLIVTMSSNISGTASIEWTTDKSPEWTDGNKVEFTVPRGTALLDYYLPVYKYPGWRGKITGLRLRPLQSVPEDGAEVALDRIHCAYDTRHAVNNTSFILASWRYYLWTGDDEFLKANIGRIRAAAHYLRTELGIDQNGLATIPYWGHDGVSGTTPKPRVGYGLGSDHWYMLPMGNKSAYTNMYCSAALKAMADLETIAIKSGAKENPYGEKSDSYLKVSNELAKKAGAFFWDAKTGRFIGCEDVNGVRHDYGFAYINLEALYYGLGDAQKAESIYSWLNGTRTVTGDTSTGGDIYQWRFAPRATTKRNLDWYTWLWNNAKSVKWGSQPQDGGATPCLSYYDVMNRIKYKSPDDAWTRLTHILDWYSGVWDSGGPAIDVDPREMTLIPLSFLHGFLGIEATQEGLVIAPKLPKSLDRAGVQGLMYHGAELNITVTPGKITVQCTKNKPTNSFLLSGRRVTGTFERTVDGGYAVLK